MTAMCSKCKPEIIQETPIPGLEADSGWRQTERIILCPTHAQQQIAELTDERDRISNDLEREVEAHGRTTRRLNVYLQTVVMAPMKLYAVHEADPVPMPTTHSLATLLDKLAQVRAALAKDQLKDISESMYQRFPGLSADYLYSEIVHWFITDRRRAAGFEEEV